MSSDYCVIMAGGVGSRFWPVSTQNTPKQFLDILGTGQSLLQLTYQRVNKIMPAKNILVVTNAVYKNLVAEHLPELPTENILTEPKRRNTAPCIAYASFAIKKKCPTARVIITPSDHLITDEETYLNTLKNGLQICANNNYLLTLGITPSRPETGYGYIQFNQKTVIENSTLRKVKTFTEKPNRELAEKFIESGDFLWNSGVFIWNVDTIMNGLEKHQPDLYEIFSAGWNHYGTAHEEAFIEEAFPQCENVSIDYGLMEKAKNVYVLPASFGWSDLGTWTSVQEKTETDKHNNSSIGKNILTYNCENSLFVNTGKKLVVADGLDGYVVAEGENAILIYPKEKEQEIKRVVNDVRLKFGEDFV